MDEQIREALRGYERLERISLREHARRLGVSAPSLSQFLRGQSGLGATMCRAIRVAHPEIADLAIDSLVGEAGTETGPRRA